MSVKKSLNGLKKLRKLIPYFLVCCSFNVIMKTTENDVIWSPLPLYHSQGGVLGIGQTLFAGSCIAFRPKFSASNFWKDIINAEATLFIYLGEICRYIYAQPVTKEERQHKIRAIIGAGLKKEIWNPFINRLDQVIIPLILICKFIKRRTPRF